MAVASLVAGCVQPGSYAPGPILLQPYPPPVSYDANPAYRPSISGPIPLQAAPLVQPLPPPTPMPDPVVTAVPADDLGAAIPVQDMPAPVADTAAPTDPAPAPPPRIVRKSATTGPGNNVPLEGFRPMHGQTRPAP